MITCVWAEKGSRPSAPRDQRYDWAYLFGAVCPTRKATAAALVLPFANAQMMNLDLAEIASQMAHRGRSEDVVIRFLLLWSAGVVLTFSLISGKQLHHLVPLLSPVTVVLGCLLPNLAFSRMGQVAALSLGILVAVRLAAQFFLFPSNDLSSVAERIMRSPGEWGVIGRHQGELSFLARKITPFVLMDQDNAGSWLASDPSRHLIDLGGKVEGLRQPVYT